MLSERAKMKLIPVYYYGFTGMDRRFSSPMLPWIVAEIRKRDFCEKVSLGVEDGVLQAYNPDFELQFSHKVSQMTRFSQADLDPTTFLYLLRDDGDRNLYCYLFQARKVSDVTELYKQMKEQNTASSMRSANSVGNLTSLCVDISPSLSNFFEVLYVGKIKVWTKKVPESFIDDALGKFKAHEAEKHHLRLLANIGRLKSAECLRRTTTDSNDTYALKRSSSSISHLSLRGGGYESTISNTATPRLTESEEEQLLEGTNQPIRENCLTDSSSGEEDKATSDSSSANHYSDTTSINTAITTRTNSASESSDGIASCDNVVTDRTGGKSDGEGKGVLDLDDHNRTMVLQVDRTDLRLISPDRKVILLHKHHRDVTTCLPGIIKVDYFGFVCKEANNASSLTGYIFKCESSSIAADAVSAITQAFSSPETKPRTTITSCEQCPMVFFHKLCVEIEHLSDRKTQAAILRRLEHLPDDDRHSILSKHRSHSALPVRDQNEHLMALLRAHSEAAQASHRHVARSDPRSVQTSAGLSHAGGIQAGGTLFTKARRSLSNSFDQLLKRRSRDDLGQVVRDMNLPLNRENSPAVSNDTSSDRDSEGTRSRSSTIGSRGDLRDGQKLGVKDFTRAGSLSPDQISVCGDKGPKSPMMDIFLKVGTSPRPDQSSPPHPAADGGSWRQAILKSVVAQGQAGVAGNRQEAGVGHTREELRALWRKSIHQAVLLVRMEKENDRLKAKQEESAVKRIKLEYDEMKLHQKEIAEVWDMMSSMKESKIKIDRQMIQNAIRQGIPRGRRGEVWQYLSEHYTEETPYVESIEPPGPLISYDKLLKQLTAHQHAILIDLGRTFPNHSYFSSPLGPGQLALFNLLKAYSLLDPEVGYCQGLSFVAGVLLLHMEESQAFSLLRHLMWTRGLRAQYLPDMAGLQVRLYQLSRLLHDHLPALYHHLDVHEVPPTLYAAPWLLTVFASQFPLGFVTRVFDLVFLESPDVVFRVALALLTCHSDQLLACESFEEIMNYMKTTLSQVDKPMLDLVMHQVFSTDISAALREYSVEYAVLREEMGAVQAAAEVAQAGLEQRLVAAEREAEVVRETAQRESEVRRATEKELKNERERCREGERRLEVLAEWIGATAAKYPGLEEEIPNEVRRIVTEACGGQRLQRPQGSPLMRMFHRAPHSDAPRTLVKSMSTGKIGVSQPIEYRSSLPNNTSEDIRRSHYIRQPMDSPIREDDAELTNKLNNNTTPLLPLANDNRHQPCSPTSSTDSGISAPGSPRAPHGVLESPHGTPETLYEDNTAANTHPLSHCDVTFSYAGTKQLRHVGSLKGYCRNSSPDMLGK